MGSTLAAFVGISILLIVAPGQDMALVTRNRLLGERKIGVSTGLGVVTGLAVWSIATAVGLAALLRASEPAFVAVKLIGAAYLVFLTLLLLGVLFCALTLLWLASYASIIAKAGDCLRRPQIRRTIGGVTGTVLLAFGLRLATEHG